MYVNINIHQWFNVEFNVQFTMLDFPEELSEEDRALKEDLEMLVTRLKEKDQSLYAASESS